MFYFDSDYLKQYADTGLKLKVYVDNEWYDIADPKDLSDKVNGVAYTQYGQPHYFDYRDIEKVKTGKNTFTLDMLQKSQTGKSTDSEESSTGKKQKSAGDFGELDNISGGLSDEGEEEPGAEEPSLEAGSEPAEPEGEEPSEKEPENAAYRPYDIGRLIIREAYRRKRNKI